MNWGTAVCDVNLGTRPNEPSIQASSPRGKGPPCARWVEGRYTHSFIFLGIEKEKPVRKYNCMTFQEAHWRNSYCGDIYITVLVSLLISHPYSLHVMSYISTDYSFRPNGSYVTLYTNIQYVCRPCGSNIMPHINIKCISRPDGSHIMSQVYILCICRPNVSYVTSHIHILYICRPNCSHVTSYIRIKLISLKPETSSVYVI